MNADAGQAVQGHDHERQQAFFAAELRSRCGNPDRPCPTLRNAFRKDENGKRLEVWPGGARYWFGIFYDVLSDFGRSIMRPMWGWVALTALFAGAYLTRHLLLNAPGCIAGGGAPLRSAAYLSLRKGLIFPGLGPDQKLDQAYACLYGTTKLSAGGRVIPIIPDSVAYLGMFQTLLSAALIFLFLLAVRNHFRIK